MDHSSYIRNDHEPDKDNDDEFKIFLSRIPSKFTEDSIRQLMEEHFGSGCVKDVHLIYNHVDTTATTTTIEAMDQGQEKNEESTIHRGFGFVTMMNLDSYNSAIQKATLRVHLPNKRKRTLYLRPIQREENKNIHDSDTNICFLWTQYRCPYGTTCKFEHSGLGGCRIISNLSSTEETKTATETKKGKCFSFKKTGKCKLGDSCPFRHVQKVKVVEGKETTKKKKSPSLAGESTVIAENEELSTTVHIQRNKKQKRDDTKVPQPLSIRVFGLNYNTTEKDVHEYFESCGKIREITFPIFEDSGRSKGYCCVWFTSPKAVQKACTDFDGKELHGRWLSVQAGKMFLRKWEEMEKSNTKVER